MKEIIFSEGGMPITLDDLSLLQSQSKLFFSLILEALVGKTDAAFTFALPEIQTNFNEGKRVYQAHVSAGSAYIKGRIVSWKAADVVVENTLKPIYLTIREVKNDQRLFEDGQERACASEMEASLSATKTEDAYDLTNMETFADLLKERYQKGDWTDVTQQIRFEAGYTGSIQLRQVNGIVRVAIDISSSKTEWATSIAQEEGQAYVLFYSPIFISEDIAQGIEVKHPISEVTIGKVKTLENGAFCFIPKNNNAKPYVCPIKITFSLV